MTQTKFQHDYLFKCMTMYEYNQYDGYLRYDNLFLPVEELKLFTMTIVFNKSLSSLALGMYSTEARIVIIYDYILRWLLSTLDPFDIYIMSRDKNNNPSAFGYNESILNYILKR